MALNSSPDFCLKLTYRYLLKAGQLRRGQFWPQGHNLNKLGIGPLGYATYQILCLYLHLMVSYKIFIRFPYISLCKTCDP